jgi:hypothetical protein
MLDDIGVSYDQADLRSHTGLRDRLAQVGAVSNATGAIIQFSGPGRRRGNHDGGDLLMRDLYALGDEVAGDFTCVSERAACRVTPALTPTSPTGVSTNAQDAATLKGAEEIKVKRYAGIYDPLNIKIEGYAMDLAGDIGPSFRAFLKRCEVLGEHRAPEWANWSAGSSFFAAWRQRYIASVQIKNAEMALRNRSRSRTANATWDARADAG